MTELGQQPRSTFNKRSDTAAMKLKGELSARHGVELPSRQVAVGPDGKPPAPPPPDGSYARAAYDQQMLELQQQQQAAGQPSQQAAILGDQPPMGTPTQQADGSQAPPLAPSQPQPAGHEAAPQSPPLSEGASARIQQLIADKRGLEHQVAELTGTQAKTQQDLQAQVNTLLSERDRFMEENLENLDPDQRLAVVTDARTRALIEQGNRDLLAQLAPQLTSLQEHSQQTEMERLATRYPRFDLTIHGPLIEMVRAKNPALTHEMAFKAVAEGDEALSRDQASVVAVPPVVTPGNGASLPRYMPEPEADPQAELVAFQQRANALLRSTDPADQRQGLRAMDVAIDERLRGANYKDKPKVFG